MPRKASLLASSLLALAVLAVNVPTWDYDFAYDDRAVVTDREPVWEQGLGEFLRQRQWGTGRHAVVLSFDFNRTEPLSTRPFHVVNTVVACAATLLVYALARTLGISAGASFVGALVFAVHPAHVDAVVSIIGRAELLAGACVLAALLLHVRGYAPRPFGLPFAVLIFFVGLSSKESALVLPLLIFLYDWLLAPARPLRSRMVPYALYGLAAAAWLAMVASHLDALDPIAFVDNPLAYVSAQERIPRAALILWRYLGLVLLPVALVPDRAYAATNPGLAEGVVSLAAWLFVIVTCWRARTRYSRAVFCALWFPAAFAITANILLPVGTIMAERLVFLPSVGPILLGAIGIDRMLQHRSRLARLGASFAVAVAVLILSFAYDARARVWTNEHHYHMVAAMESPNSAKAHYNLGLERARAQDWGTAEAAFRRAIEIYPPFSMAAYYLAGVLIETGHPEEAITVYQAYLVHNPADTGVLSQLASLQLALDRMDEAAATASRLVELEPEHAEHRNLLDLIQLLREARGAAAGSVLEGQLENGQPEAPHQ